MRVMLEKQSEERKQEVELMKNQADNMQKQMTERMKNHEDNQTNYLIAQMKEQIAAESANTTEVLRALLTPVNTPTE
jgi:predicted membrane chloride channel (bestrophin family)